MTTQRELALRGTVTAPMRRAAGTEGVAPETVRAGLAAGTVVLLKSAARREDIAPLACGAGLRVKVNANIGTSPRRCDVEDELRKLAVAVEAGADAVMDLSVGGDLDAIRRRILAASPLPVGTVPVYQAAADSRRRGSSPAGMTSDDFFDAVERHLDDGVDFVTVHCGVTRRSLEKLHDHPRVMGIVSRGGALTASWMAATGRENPLFEKYDRLLELARARDAVLSLGDGLRPGCLADATDPAQVEELVILGDLTARALAAGVQVMVEGPGHVPLDQVEANVRLQKRLCHGAPFYVLGPLVTDVGAGHDHVSAAIGGALAAYHGADFLCYVTPAEHLHLPSLDDVARGVTAAKIAGHAADVARGRPGARERDLAMSRCRKALDWDGQERHALDPGAIRRLREQGCLRAGEGCDMCGDFCPYRQTGAGHD